MSKFIKGSHFTNEQMDMVRNMSTVEVIQKSMGFTFKRAGSDQRCIEHDSLVVFKDGKGWKWYSQDKSGCNAIDFMMKIHNYSFQEAVATLLGNDYGNGISQSAYTNDKPVERKPFKLPQKTSGRYDQIYAYLMKTRCIDFEVVNYCVQNKILYQDEKANCVFVGRDDNGEAKYATRRGTLTLPGIKPFKGEVSGSNKMFGFKMEGTCQSHLFVFEAPIDALSHATLNIEKAKGMGRQDYKTSWQRHTRLALGGVADVALDTYLVTHPRVKEISFCLDNDESGRNAAQKHMKKYTAQGYKVNIYSVPEGYGKDYNEYLLHFQQVKKNAICQKAAAYNKQRPR